MNKRGPNIDPWGTPHVIVLVIDFLSLISTYCFLLARYEQNHSFDLPLIPYHSSFFTSILWSMVSNALLKSSSVVAVNFFSLRAE